MTLPGDLNALLDQNAIVLTASRRLAHALRASFAQHAQAQGRSAWPTPRISPWTAWLREQFRERRAAHPGSNARLLTAFQARVLWRRVVAESAFGERLLNAAGAARLAEKSWRRLHDYLIPLGALERFPQPEAQALASWCAAFAEKCAALNLIDEAQLPHWAAAEEVAPQSPVALAGFDVRPPTLERLIERWRATGKFVERSGDARAGANVQVLGARDAASELELAARWARAQHERHRRSLGVLVPGLQRRRQDVRRVFEDIFAPGARSGLEERPFAPVVIAAAGPLADFPLVDAAVSVLRLADRSDATALGRLLRSPFIVGGVSERDARATADFLLREEQRDGWTWLELEHWSGLSAAPALMRSARAVASILRAEASPAAPSRWVERFHTLLQAAGWPGERALNSDEHQTLQKFQLTLAEFGSLDALSPRLSLRQALSHLQELLRETPFEPESPRAAVTVIDPATSAGMSFDALWVCGLDAERWPAPANPDPLIPLELQRAAGVPEASAEGMRTLANAQLARWMATAGEVVMSWPMREGDAELEPAPLIRAFPSVELDEVNVASTRSFRVTLFEHRPALERFVDDQAPKLPQGAARGGARTLELQSLCPFKAQAELRLHAKSTPQSAVGIEPRQRGKILHGVLEQLWRRLRDQTTLAAYDPTALRTDVRELAERETARVLRVATGHRARLARLEVESVTRTIMRLLEIERARPPFQVRFAEAAQIYQISGLTITLRPDRVDELANHGALLIDYKLGERHAARHWLDELPGRPRSPQLPLYALAHEPALEGLAFVTLAPGAVEYRGWSRSALVGAGVPTYPAKIRKQLNPPPDWPALIEHWRRTLGRLASAYVQGEAEVDPLPQACVQCHLSTLCRIHERSAGAARVERSDE